jgi:hypothetical protein
LWHSLSNREEEEEGRRGFPLLSSREDDTREREREVY